MAVSKRTRYEVLRRDDYTCRYCRATDTPLTIDHVVPTTLGGSDDPSNLVAACKDCNAGKSSSNPDAALVAQVDDDTARWAAAMKVAAERLAANKAEVSRQIQPWFDDWWTMSGSGWAYRLPDDAETVLQQYLAAGMPLQVLRDAARVALAARGVDNRFRYFRGVANNMLADLQRDATAVLAAESSPTSYRCDSCKYTHDQGECGFWTGWRIGITDCSIGQHPDHYQTMALSRVVDASAHEWAATWPYPSELYPIYSGRGCH